MCVCVEVGGGGGGRLIGGGRERKGTQRSNFKCCSRVTRYREKKNGEKEGL